MNCKDEEASEDSIKLSPQQRQSIEDLVQLSPPVIKPRVRRDGLSAAQALSAYTGHLPHQVTQEKPLFELRPFEM